MQNQVIINHQKILGGLVSGLARARMATFRNPILEFRTSEPCPRGTPRPDPSHTSTSHVERQNLTMRVFMRHFTRLTNGFSKKVENHLNALALYFVFYNFCRIHETLRVTPAMAADITDELMDMSHIVRLMDQAEEAPKKRRPYKKRVIA